MKLYENAIRKKVDAPTIKILNLWHTLCEQKIGDQIEVMIDNEELHASNLTEYEEDNRVWPEIFNGKVMPRLHLESLTDDALCFKSLTPADNILISHEIGHGILKLKGFTACMDRTKKYYALNVETALNSMAHHPPLYELQRRNDIDPQIVIDKRTKGYIKDFSESAETDNDIKCKKYAIILADELLNCSNSYKKKLERIVKKKHPKTSKLLDIILNLAKSCDLLKPEQNLEFKRKLIQNLKLDSDWIKHDVVEELKSLVEQARS